MSIDRYNCFGGSCAAASAQMLAAIIAWRDRIADMIPKVPQNVGLSTKITEQQILQWMQSDQATIPAADREFVKIRVLPPTPQCRRELSHGRIIYIIRLSEVVHEPLPSHGTSNY
jgi:hypothetical protein